MVPYRRRLGSSLDELSAQELYAHMLINRRVVIGGCMAFGLLAGMLVFHGSGDDSRAYTAESFLMVRPFNNALLARAFEREVQRTSPGVTRLGYQVLRASTTTPKGTTWQTNGMISNWGRPAWCARILDPEVPLHISG